MASDTQIAVPRSYQQYKADTAVFLAWLQRTALKCGYEYDAKHTSSVKDSLPVVKIKVADWQLPVREIIEQARVICDSTSSTSVLPRAVFKAAKRAIKTRENFGILHRKVVTGDGDHQNQNDSHAHFTHVLKSALDILVEHATIHQSWANKAHANAHGEMMHDDEVMRDRDNLFEHLELHECEETKWSLHEPQIRSAAGNKNCNKQDHNNKRESTDDTNAGLVDAALDHGPFDVAIDREDLCMRIVCHFIDVDRLRAQVHELWLQHKDGSIGLIPVAMAANAAIALAEQSERELLAYVEDIPLPDFFLNTQFAGLHSTHGMLIAIAISARVNQLGEPDPAAINAGDDDAFLTDAAVIVSKLSVALQDRKKKSRTIVDYFDNMLWLRKSLTSKEGISETIMKKLGEKGMESSYDFEYYPRVATARIQFLMISRFCDETFARQTFQKFVEKDEFLTPLLIDMVLLHETASLQAGRQWRSGYNDELTRAIVDLQDGKVGSAAVLSATILYDIHESQADRKPEMLRGLHEYAEECWELVKHYRPGPDSLRSGVRPLWHASDGEHLRIIHSNYLLVRDKVADCPRQMGSWEATQKRIAMYQPPETFYVRDEDTAWIDGIIVVPIDEHVKRAERAFAEQEFFMPFQPNLQRVWIDNPIGCGSMMYDLALARESAGICVANTHVSIVPAAYIYTALRCQGLLQGTWVAMDEIIAEFTGPMFFGSLPSSPAEFFDRFMWRMGRTTSHEESKNQFSMKADGGARTGTLGRTEAQLSCLSISDTAHAFAQWLNGEKTLIKTIHEVLKLMAKKDAKQPKKGRRMLPSFNVDTLLPFTEHIASDCERMDIDYVTMTSTCNAFMEAIARWYMTMKRLGPDNKSMSGLMIALLHEDWINSNPRMPDYWLYTLNLLMIDQLWSENGNGALKKVKKVFGFDVDDLAVQSPMKDLGAFVQGYMDERALLSHGPEAQTSKKLKLGVLRKPLHARAEEIEDEETALHSRREWGDWPLLPREVFF